MKHSSQFSLFLYFILGAFILTQAALLRAQCDIEEPTETLTFGGHLDSKGEAFHEMPTSASEKLELTINLVADNPHYGAAVEWEILSETGLSLNWDDAAVYDPVTAYMSDRGDTTACANPGTFRIKSLIWGFTYTVTVEKIDRVGWNHVGTSWETASLIKGGETFCGSMNEPLNECDPDHYFKVYLAPNDTLYVNGIFTASERVGSAVTLRIYDHTYQEKDLLLNVAAYGTVEDDAIYVNKGLVPEMFYLILHAWPWDLWAYELYYEKRGYNPPVTVTLTPDKEPVIIPSGGGKFGLTAEVQNNTAGTLSFKGWVDVILPGQKVMSPFLGPKSFKLGPGEKFSKHLIHKVPGGAPAGIYIYRGITGIYPDNIWDFDEIIVTKME